MLTIKVRLALAAALTLALTGAASAQTPAQVENEILKAANDLRAQNGAPALHVSPTLVRIAEAHAQNMARQDKYGDNNNGHYLDGKGPEDRLKAGGYKYTSWAENVGWNQGFADPGAKMMQDWIASPGHHANLVNKDMTETGIGAAKGASGKWYFVQVFGRPVAGAATVAVNVSNRTYGTIRFTIEGRTYSVAAGHNRAFSFTTAAGTVTVTYPGHRTATLHDGAYYAFEGHGGYPSFVKIGGP